ncbi:MAG: energy transducer TonB [Magnetospirillum gryphiswaldense]|nr:energy transducer TonB [Magnetospirillum gryphiswaldense]
MIGEIRLVPPVSWRRNGRGPLFAAILHGGLLGVMVAGFMTTPPKIPPQAISSMVVEVVPLSPPTPQPAPAAMPEPPPQPAAAPIKPKSPAPRPVAKPRAAEPLAPSPEPEPAPASEVSSAAPAAPSAGTPAGPAKKDPEASAPAFVPPRSDVAGLDNPHPPYPTLARRRGWEGLVVLMVLVDEMGMAQKVALHQSSGHDILDQSALHTVKSWRFVPARQGGHTVPASVQVPIRFSLDGKA